MDVIIKLKDFYEKFKGEKGFIGKTEAGENIPYFKLGNGSPTIIVVGGVHAREYITTYLVMELIKEGLACNYGTAYFVPMLNIDGVKICLNGNDLYKANGNMVDLNVNFDAMFGQGIKNLSYKHFENYVGPFPFSESETRALRDFTLRVAPDMTISYHSKGEEIYYNFFQGEKRLRRDLSLAKVVEKNTGYKIKTTYGSVGGYKDWCIYKLFIPSLTVEVGNDALSHPVKKECLTDIYEKNRGTVTLLLKKIKELKESNEY